MSGTMLSRRRFMRVLSGATATMLTSSQGHAVVGDDSAGKEGQVRIAPNTGQPILKDLLAEVERARATGRIRLDFPEGEYILSNGDPLEGDGVNKILTAEVTFKGFDEVIIQGQGAGAEFLCSSFFKGAFKFEHCKNVSVTNIKIDWPRPPFSTGVVTASTGSEVEVLIDDDFPVDKRLPVSYMLRFDPGTGAPWPAPDGLIMYNIPRENTTYLGPQRLRVKQTFDWAIPVGAVLSLQHANYGYQGMMFWHCDDIVLKDVTLGACPGMGFLAYSGRNITMTRCRVVPSKRQRRRFVTATADGSHFCNFSGHIELKDCQFEGTGDDPHNTWCVLFEVLERSSDTTLRLTHPGVAFMFPQRVEAGDVFEFNNLDTMAPQAKATVKSVKLQRHLGSYLVIFTEPLPKWVQAGTHGYDATRMPSLTIRRCRFANARGRGVLATTRNVIIEDNTFERLQHGGIQLSPEMFKFKMAAGLDNVLISRNRFINCNLGPLPSWGEIFIGAIMKGYRHGAAGINRNIVIRDNHIENTGTLWLHLGSTDGVVVENNTIVNGNSQDGYIDWMFAAVTLVNSRNVRFEGNRFSWSRGNDRAYSFWDIKENVDPDTLILKNNQGFPPLPTVQISENPTSDTPD